MSQIQLQDVDQNFPVAGVNNDSQGFRDNYVIINNNFAITEEILNYVSDVLKDEIFIEEIYVKIGPRAEGSCDKRNVFYFVRKNTLTNIPPEEDDYDPWTEYELVLDQYRTYRFILEDPSLAPAPLRFSETPDTNVEPGDPSDTITDYTDNVVFSTEKAGNPGSYVDIFITQDTPNPLYFYGEQIGLDTSGLGAEKPIPVGIKRKHGRFDEIIVDDLTTNTNSETSDISKKTNITPIQSPIEKILQLQGVEYELKKDNQKSIGMIAQDVEKILPELVTGDEGNKGIMYSRIVSILVEGIKELNNRVDFLENLLKESDTFKSLKTTMNKSDL